jgi:hypothetical protein
VLYTADAYRNDGKRLVVHADEKLTAFIDSNLRFALAANWLDRLARFFKTWFRQTDSNQAEEISPARFFASSGPAIAE